MRWSLWIVVLLAVLVAAPAAAARDARAVVLDGDLDMVDARHVADQLDGADPAVAVVIVIATREGSPTAVAQIAGSVSHSAAPVVVALAPPATRSAGLSAPIAAAADRVVATRSTAPGHIAAALGGDVEVTVAEPSFWLRVAQRFAHPTLVAVLLVVGVLGIALEVVTAGSLFPGLFVAGGALVAAIVGMSLLPVWWPALVAMAAGVALVAWELRRPMRGVAAALGAVALVAGAVGLFGRDDPTLRPSPAITAPLTGLAVIAAVITGRLVAKVAHQPALIGVDALIGRDGEVYMVEGGIWRMRLDGGRWTVVPVDGSALFPGAMVRVVGVRADELTLEVHSLQGGGRS